MMRGFAALAFCAAFATPAAAEDKVVGDWLISTEKDRFSTASGSTKTIAARSSGDNLLGVRCFPDGISLMLVDLRGGISQYTQGANAIIKFRADDKSVIEAIGGATSNNAMQLSNGREMLNQMLGAKEYAFRIIYQGVTSDVIFSAGKGAKAALETISKACPEKR